MKQIAIGVVTLALLFCRSDGARAEMVLLGVYPSAGYSINNLGQIVGPTQITGFEWYAPNGTVNTAIPFYAEAINNHGQIVGGSTGNGDGEAYLLNPGTGLVDLGLGIAMGINDEAQVVGYHGGGGLGAGPAFIWDQINGRRNLGFSGEARAINDSGQVVGMTSSGNAYVWDPISGMTLLPNPPGSPYGRGYGINDSGQVVVGSFSTNVPNGSILWDPIRGITDLNFAAYGINNTGQVVGESITGGEQAVLWDQNNGITDLGIPAGHSDSLAFSINDKGWVTGWSDRNADGNPEAFVWAAGQDFPAPNGGAVPEPASLILLGIGIAGMAAYSWRRRKQSDAC